MRDECVIFYVKWPQKGRVKTRLSREVGGDCAVALYRCFILDLADTLKKLSQDVILCYSPKDAEAQFRSWLGERFHYLPQTDGDLGTRMNESFVRAFAKGYKRALLIGSDTPDLSVEDLQQAFKELEENDAVIGPAVDGGYWLIGFQSGSFTPCVFEGISWSTKTVFSETMKRFRGENLRVWELPERMDIDSLDALSIWYEGRNPLSKAASRTRSYLERTQIKK
jgi:rSAM/selenodomain-associated transferase 1